MDITEEMINSYYSSMLDSVSTIEKIISGEYVIDDDILSVDDLPAAERIVFSNKFFLEEMLLKSFWTSQDMTPINDTILRANEYLGE